MSLYGSDGVDVTLIRWMLSLTPAERLAVLQDFTDFIWEVRTANSTKSEPRDPSDADRIALWVPRDISFASRGCVCTWRHTPRN